MIDTFPIPRPLGPLNQRDSEIEIGIKAPGSLIDVLNMDFYEEGLRTRPGFTVYTTVSLGLKFVHSLHATKRDDGTEILLAVSGTSIFKEGTLNGLFSAVKSGITDGALYDFETLANLIIGVNGIAADAVKFDGTTFFPFPITPPASGPTATLAPNGHLSGDYSYKVSFVSKFGGETNVGVASNLVSASSNVISLVNIPIGGPDVGRRRLYRTLSGQPVYFLLATIDNNTDTTFNDDISDTDLGTDEAPIFNDPPPGDLEFLIVWKNFVFGLRTEFPTKVFFSYQDFPEIWNTDPNVGFFLNVGLSDGEFIIGFGKVGSTLFIFKESSSWPVTGNTPDDFKVVDEPINDAVGFYHRSISRLPDGQLVGLHSSGIYKFNGYAYEKLSDRPNDSIQPLINRLNRNRLKYAMGFYDDKIDTWFLDVTESGFSYNNKTIVWDRLRDRFTIYDTASNGRILWKNQVLMASSKDDGLIHKVGGTSDNGVAIQVLAEWPWWSLWDADCFKLVKFIQMEVTQLGDYRPTLEIYINGKVKVIPVPMDALALWGSGRWVLDGGIFRIIKLLAIDRKDVARMKAIFSHNGKNQPVTINGFKVFGCASNKVIV